MSLILHSLIPDFQNEAVVGEERLEGEAWAVLVVLFQEVVLAEVEEAREVGLVIEGVGHLEAGLVAVVAVVAASVEVAAVTVVDGEGVAEASEDHSHVGANVTLWALHWPKKFEIGPPWSVLPLSIFGRPSVIKNVPYTCKWDVRRDRQVVKTSVP